jgi:4-hydroxybenzoate polyprenyltransferase/putative flippase GtrA
MSRTFLRFLVVGAIATAANWGSNLGFVRVMDLRWSVLAAGLVGLVVSYALNRLFVFGRSDRPAWQETARFALVNALAVAQIWLVTLGLVRFGFPLIGFAWRPEAVAHAIGVLVPVLTSYLGHRHFTFARSFPRAAAQEPGAVASGRTTPLAVDLDGTLLRTDVLFETFVAGLVSRPWSTLKALLLIHQGRARLKARLAAVGEVDVASLPVRQALVRRLEAERAAGRPLHLVTGADHSLAQRIAARFGLFDTVHGSRDGVNLKGARKLAFLRARFPDGFAYAGDSEADLRVWTEADSVLVAGAGRGVAARVRTLNKPLEAEIEVGGGRLRAWRKALRLHQWSKNALIFVPMLLGLPSAWPAAALACAAGFLAMGVAASATYLVNDLADLSADRVHATKRLRPLASGDLPVAHALVAAPVMLALALAAAGLLNPAFGLALAVYLVVTLAYSFRLKRVPLLDVHVLGGLYTLRLAAGTVLAGVAFSAWLLTFSFFFFTAMALAKRYAELVAAQGGPADRRLAGRGYQVADAAPVLALGAATSTASVLVIVEYMMAEAFHSSVYRAPAALWAAPMLVSLWASRIWLLAHRGRLTADPVEFAVRDRVSLVLGAVLAAALVVARL